jgi:hypothetical protein
MGEASYPDPREVALLVKPVLKYGPSCRALDVVVRGSGVSLASESVAVCENVVFDKRGVVVELRYDVDTVDKLPIETVNPEATPKQ